jgi:hypothetical protein
MITLNIILLTILVSCFGQIKVNNEDRQRAEETEVMYFFVCMTSNEYYEKIAKNNYYIFDTINRYLYYEKVHSRFFKGTITEIFKVNVDVLQKQLPNFRKLHGAVLREIILSDISKKNKISNKSEIIVKNISYKLNNAIIVSVNFSIGGREQQKIYKLNTTDFNIINNNLCKSDPDGT